MKSRLDISQKKEFKTGLVIPLIIYPVVFIFLAGWFGQTGLVPIGGDGLGFLLELAIYVVLFIFGVIELSKARIKNKREKKAVSAYRTTEGIFNLGDPQSIIESIILYQDYTSENLVFDIRKNNYCTKLLYHMLEKSSFIKLENNILYIDKGVDNKWLNELILTPLNGNIKAIQIGESCLVKFWSFSRENVVMFEETQQQLIYHFDTILDYSAKVRAGLKELSDYTARENWDENKARDIRSYIYDMGEFLYELWDTSEEIENQTRMKYFLPGKRGRTALDRTNPATCMFGYSFLYISIPLATNILFSMAWCGAAEWFLSSIVAFICSYPLAIIKTYTRLMKDEAEEVLTPEGQEIVDKIAGLKMFIKDYTQLKNPSTDNLYKIWDEFVLFAKLFGFNDKLYEIAKENGMEYENDELLDYFSKNNPILDNINKTNENVCLRIPYPVSKGRSAWYTKPEETGV